MIAAFADVDLSDLAWRHLCQVTVLIPLALLLARFVARWSKHFAYALLVILVIKCVTPPLWNSQSSLFRWMPLPDSLVVVLPEPETGTDSRENGSKNSVDDSPRRRSPLIDRRQDDATNVIVTGDDWMNGDADLVKSRQSAPLIQPESEGKQRIRTATMTSAVLLNSGVGEPVAEGWGYIFFAVLWGLPMLVILVRLALRGMTLERWYREESKDPSGEQLGALHRVCMKLDVDVIPRLIITRRPSVPLVFGVRRPVVVIPEELVASASISDLELILGHEVNHLRRRDTLVGRLQAVTQAVWWFHPMVWWLNAEVRRLREECCDEEVVVRLECSPKSYARCLWSVLDWSSRLDPSPGMISLSPFEVTRRRFESLASKERQFSNSMPIWSWPAIFAVALLVLPGGGVVSQVTEGITGSNHVAMQEFMSLLEADLEPAALNANESNSGGQKSTTLESEAPSPTEIHSASQTVIDPVPPPEPLELLPLFDTIAPYVADAEQSRSFSVAIQLERSEGVEEFRGTPHLTNLGAGEDGIGMKVSNGQFWKTFTPAVDTDSRFPSLAIPRTAPPDFTDRGDLRCVVSPNGKILLETGAIEMPALLPGWPQLLLVEWSSDHRKSWTTTHSVRVSEPSPLAVDRIVGLSHTRYTRSPGQRNDITLLSAIQTDDWSVTDWDETTIRLERRLHVETELTIQGRPKYELTLVGTMQFDQLSHLPQSVDFAGWLIQRDASSETRVPVTVTADGVVPAPEFEAAPVEAAPVEAAPVEAAPVEAAPR